MPSLVIVAFVLLAVSTYVLEEANPGWMEPAHRFMRSHVFGEQETTSNLLGTVATGIITITSITFCWRGGRLVRMMRQSIRDFRSCNPTP